MKISESFLVGQGVVIGIGRCPDETLLGAQSVWETQIRYEAPVDLRFET